VVTNCSINRYISFFFFRMSSSLRHIQSPSISRPIPFNCLGGHRPAIYKSLNPCEFRSSLYCPSSLNPAPPPLPGSDRPCHCRRCSDWALRQGRQVLSGPLLGTTYGLRPRCVLEEAARDGVHWYLLSYWDCANLDWVPSSLIRTIPSWPTGSASVVDIAGMVSVHRAMQYTRWAWVLLDRLV
jgi:hypothetical protein